MAAVLKAAEQSGLTKSEIARAAGIHRSQASRWFSGEQRPGYDRAIRIVAYLRRERPELAEEFLAASGYGGPAEPEPDIPPDVLALIRRRYRDPEQQRQVIEALTTIGPPAAAESSETPRRTA